MQNQTLEWTAGVLVCGCLHGFLLSGVFAPPLSLSLGASVNGKSISNTGSHRGVCIALLGHQGVIVWPGLVQNHPHPERPQSDKVLASSIWVSNMWRGPHPSRNLGCLEEMSDRTKESKPNQARQPTPGERFAVLPAPATRRGCAHRWATHDLDRKSTRLNS